MDFREKVFESEVKKLMGRYKVEHMLKITSQDEINALRYQIAKSFGYGNRYNSLKKHYKNIVNTELEKILCIRYDGLGTIELRSKLYPIKCYRSKGTTAGKTLWENLDRCKNHIGKCTSFITRDGLDAIFCSNHGLKNQVLVYVDER